MYIAFKTALYKLNSIMQSLSSEAHQYLLFNTITAVAKSPGF